MRRGRKHTEEKVQQRRAVVAELYLKGLYQSEIAALTGVTQQQISIDLKTIRQEWLESGVRNFDEAKEIELRKLDRVEREAWKSWERSLEKAQTQKKETGDTPAGPIDKRTETTEKRYGDPRFLQLVKECIDKRTEILGLNAPAKIAPTDPTGQYPYSEIDLSKLSEAELEQLLAIVAKSQGEEKS